MTYANQPGRTTAAETTAVQPVVEYHDRVRWGPIIAGLVVALATQLVLTALGSALGLSTIAASDAPRTSADEVGTAIGIWTIVSLFAALFAGGWVTARTSGPISKNATLLNGIILWATTLAIGAYLTVSGVSGFLGTLGANERVTAQAQRNIPGNLPNVTAEQARDIAGRSATAGWTFTIGSLLGLGATLLGSNIGARRVRVADQT
jgi:hypothetical protein